MMKRFFTHIAALALVLISTVLLPPAAKAAGESDLTFQLNGDGLSYYVSDCAESADGELVIPATYNGKAVTGIGSRAFENCTSMTSITIPGSVTDIDVQAFWGCTGLTSITIPAGVISIGDYAFTDCTGLTSITIPDSVTTIGDDAFYGCPVKTLIIADGSQTITSTMVVCKDTLEKVFIPDSVTSIRNYAFENCTNLTSVTIGNGITTIGVYAFKDCTGLTSIVIPNSVTSIGEGTLSGCSSLTSITIPFVGSNKKTAEDAYQYPLGIIFGRSSYPGSVATEQCYYGANLSSTLCDTFYIPTALKSVTVTGGDILFGAFDSCAGLTNIVLPDEAASIGDYAFYGCTSLTGIILPDGITSIGEYAFYGCNRLTSVSMPDSVTSIDEGAFYGCTALTSITIPSNVRNIGDEAFKNCTSLLSVTLYDHYDYFATSAFDGCQVEKLIIADGSITVDSKMVICKGTLKEIVIPDSVGNIKEAAFSGCGSLESITIPFVGRYSHTSSYYAENLFGYIFGAIPYSGGVATQEHGNPPLNSQVYYIPAGLKSVTVIRGDIAYEAFNNCCGLTNITLLDHVKSIGAYAFSNCTGLTSIAIPKDVTVISDFAFARCTNLTSVVLPDSITNIGAYAFSACSSLVDIALPNGVKSIGAYAFSACSSLVEITIPNGITSISRNAFDSCTSLTNVILPAGLTEIGDNAFFDCTHLTSITIPDSAVNIGNFAFYHCADMTHITLGNHIVSIGDYAFSDCTSLASVTYCGTQAQWDAIRVGYYNGCLTDASLQLHSGLNGVCTVCGREIAYTITFQNWDGAVLSKQTYYWGDVVTAPADPTRVANNTYAYTFAGWDKPVINCAGDATYKATYNAVYIDYTIVFKDEDGTVLSSQTYHWGDVVTAPSNPAKAADNTYTYTFAGWDKPVVNCAGDVTYTATYKAAYIDYVVKFLNEDGTELSTKTYHWGDVVTAPANPTKAADRTYTYTFAGWDKTVVNCAGNATYKATYSAAYINYTVVFKNWDGTVLSSKTYHYGDAVSEPGAPTRPNDDKYAYAFVGWDKTVVNCAGDATYTAVYSAVSLVPNTITSSTHTVRDGIISKITVGTITDQLINALNEKSYAKVFSGTTEVPGSALVGTGMEVRIMDGDTVTVSATAVVTGDINGDGKITVTDFVQMKAHLLKKSTLQGASAHAADTSGDGNISVTDFVQMKAHLLGKNPVQPQSVPATTPVSAALSVSQNDASEQEPVAAVSYTHIVALVPDKKTLITV